MPCTVMFSALPSSNTRSLAVRVLVVHACPANLGTVCKHLTIATMIVTDTLCPARVCLLLSASHGSGTCHDALMPHPAILRQDGG